VYVDGAFTSSTSWPRLPQATVAFRLTQLRRTRLGGSGDGSQSGKDEARSQTVSTLSAFSAPLREIRFVASDHLFPVTDVRFSASDHRFPAADDLLAASDVRSAARDGRLPAPDSLSGVTDNLFCVADNLSAVTAYLFPATLAPLRAEDVPSSASHSRLAVAPRKFPVADDLFSRRFSVLGSRLAGRNAALDDAAYIKPSSLRLT
jgi:hypothetical protein